MNWFKRFIWWKCALWVALGAGLGAAVGVLIPEPGPGFATRISAEEFVSIFAYPALAEGEHISAVTMYPPQEGVDFLKFDIAGRHSLAGFYVYGQRPLVRVETLRAYERKVAVDQAKGHYLGLALAMRALRAKETESKMDRFKQWDSVSTLLAEEKKTHPDIQIRSPISQQLWRKISIVAGAFVVGGLCSLLLARRSKDEQAAYELMRVASAAPPLPAVASGPSAEDLAKNPRIGRSASAKPGERTIRFRVLPTHRSPLKRIPSSPNPSSPNPSLLYWAASRSPRRC